MPEDATNELRQPLNAIKRNAEKQYPDSPTPVLLTRAMFVRSIIYADISAAKLWNYLQNHKIIYRITKVA